VPRAAGSVLVTPGAKPILFYGFLATLSPAMRCWSGSRIFPSYASMVRFCVGPGLIPPRLTRTRARFSTRWRSDYPAHAHGRVQLAFESTGAVVPEADLRRLAALANGTTCG